MEGPAVFALIHERSAWRYSVGVYPDEDTSWCDADYDDADWYLATQVGREPMPMPLLNTKVTVVATHPCPPVHIRNLAVSNPSVLYSLF